MKKRFLLLPALVIVLILMFIAIPSSSKATDLPFSEQEIETKRSCFVNGTKRTYYRLKNKHVYYQINNDDPMLLTSDAYRSGMDHYGTVWAILDEYSEEIFVGAYNYDLMGDLTFFLEYWDPTIPYDPYDDSGFVYDAVRFNEDKNGLIVSFSTEEGKTYPTLTFEQLKRNRDIGNLVDLPSPSPSPTIEPSNTPKPTSNIKNTPVPPQKKIAKNNKLSIHKQSLYKGKQLVGKYSLKKGVLKYKRPSKKTLKYTAVKFVYYTEKGKLVFITKKEAAYDVSLTGKKHQILKKGAKEFITKKKAKIAIKGAKVATKIRKRNGKCMKL